MMPAEPRLWYKISATELVAGVVTMKNSAAFSTTLMLPGEMGWHLRPAALLAKLAHMFDSDIVAEQGIRSVNARSILGVVMMCASGVKHLRVTARGHDAEAAIKAIETEFLSSAQVKGAKSDFAPPPEANNFKMGKPNHKQEEIKEAGMTVRKAIANLSSKNKAASTTFTCPMMPEATRAFVAGDFNGWDPQADDMKRQDGRFVKSVKLTLGEHQYKFVIDGEWFVDPSAPTVVSEIGTLNNVVHV